MNLTDLLLLLFGVSGISWTVVQSTIMDIIGLRQWLEKWDFVKKLTNCSFCFSFHVGWSYGLFLYYLNTLGSFWFYVLTIPFASACAGFVYERLLFLMIEVIEGVEKRNKEK